MRLLKLVMILGLLLSPLCAQEANFEFRPGKSLGEAALGQSREQMLEAFPDWTYGIDPRSTGHSYYFPESQPTDFICSFSPDGALNEFTLESKGLTMRNSPEIGPGSSKETIERKFGVPSTNTYNSVELGGYWDYDHLGVCFHFPGTSRDGAKYGAGNVGSISLYKPGTSRFNLDDR